MEGIRTLKLDSTLKHSVELNRYKQKRAPASNLAPNLMILVGLPVFYARFASWGSLSLPGDEENRAECLLLLICRLELQVCALDGMHRSFLSETAGRQIFLQ